MRVQTGWPGISAPTGSPLNAGICSVGGVAFFGYAVLSWAQLNFGPLSNPEIPRIVMLGLTLIVIALQVFFSAFLLGVLEIPVKRQRAGPINEGRCCRAAAQACATVRFLTVGVGPPCFSSC